MVNFLIATHGRLAEGFRDTMRILMGDEICERLSTINAFAEGDTSDPKQAISEACMDVKPDDQLIIFTDVMYGSVNQFVMPCINERIFVITGVNFPLLLEVISKYSFDQDAKVDEDVLREDVKKSRMQIIYVNDEMKKNHDSETNDESEFFD
jgi:mannose/fructose-specific phosphotransferase system component IIA